MVKNNRMKCTISGEDHRRIASAIGKAKAETSGEIYVVLAGESDDYFYPACFVLCFVTLALAVACAFWLHWHWRGVALHTFGLGVLAFYGLLLFYLLFIPSLRLWLTPASIRMQKCHLNAMRQFLAHNVHRTRRHTAILLFISLAEHYAEVIAGTGINEKVAQEEWQDIVDILTAHARRGMLANGYIKAIEKAGALLGQHFPSFAGDENVLPDHLVEL